MSYTVENTTEFALLEAIAAALGRELGAEIEEQPAYQDPAEAGQVNRAFRITAEVALRRVVLPGENPAALVSRVLLALARRRLAASGLGECDLERLLQLERKRDDWLAFLLLTTDTELQHLLQTEPHDHPSGV